METLILAAIGVSIAVSLIVIIGRMLVRRREEREEDPAARPSHDVPVDPGPTRSDGHVRSSGQCARRSGASPKMSGPGRDAPGPSWERESEEQW